MNKIVNLLATGILGIMFVLMLSSSWNDSAIIDELAHIPAGYSYWTEHQYRLNPEHPPLIKMFATFPLLFQNIHFPSSDPAWTTDVNGQWDMGTIFLYQSGNDPDSILHWTHLPIMILALLTGWLLFAWVRKWFGNRAALLTLFLFAFSPTVIAHSRFVTTDLGATFGFLIGIITFINFLERSTWKNAVLAGITLGVAELLKFSLVLLPIMQVIILFFWMLARKKDAVLSLKHPALLKKCFVMFVIAGLCIWPIYQFTVWNYPPERQRSDATAILQSVTKDSVGVADACSKLKTLVRCPAELVIWASDKPAIRPYAEYLLGVLMVVQRATGGNTSYFLGDVSNIGSRWYFPVAYVLKEPVPILLLEFLALYLALSRIAHPKSHSWKLFLQWVQHHLVEFSSLIIILVYWAFSIKSPLNIGIRHVLPTFPFFYLLTSIQLDRWLRYGAFVPQPGWFAWFRELVKTFLHYAGKRILIFGLLLWLLEEMFLVFPSYLSYYNEFTGGTANGYWFIVDSNYDWGQDLKRLHDFVIQNDIQHIAVDYFGGGNLSHYFGNTADVWHASSGPAHGWFAVSATFLMSAQGKPTDGFVIKPEDSYDWLRVYTPIARAGQSIFIYKLP